MYQRKKGSLNPASLTDCLSGKPITYVKNYEHTQGQVYEGKYRGIKTITTYVRFSPQEDHYFAIETDNKVYYLQLNACLKYNAPHLRENDQIKVVFEGVHKTKGFYSFAVIKKLPEQWVVAATGKPVVGEWNVEAKSNATEFVNE